MILPPFDSTRATQAARKRWDRMSKAVRGGVGKAGEQIVDVQKNDAYATIAAISEQHAMQAYNAGERGSASSFRILLDSGWPSPDKVASPEAPTVDTSGIDQAELKEMLAAWRKHKEDNGLE